VGSFRIGLPARLSAATIETLVNSLAEAKASDARVWVLEGEDPDAFCRGMDLSSVANAEEGRVAVGRFAEALRLLSNAPRPTVAVVHAEALGGGVGIMAACDLVVASEKASVALPEGLFGILPAMIMPSLLTRMSPQKARLLSLTCTAAPATWAHDAGLFDRLSAPEKLERAKKRAVRDLSRVNPGAVARLRSLIHMADDTAFEPALEKATEIAAETVADAEVQRTVALFLEEGVAPWTA